MRFFHFLSFLQPQDFHVSISVPLITIQRASVTFSDDILDGDNLVHGSQPMQISFHV